MSDRRLSPKYFAWPAALVAARQITFLGVDYSAGDDLPIDEADKGMAMRLWLSRRAVYKDDFNPTPINSAPLDKPFLIENKNNGSYAVHLPWEDEPTLIKGKKKAEEFRDKMQDKGEPLSHHGVTIRPTEKDDVFAVKADWIDAEFAATNLDDAKYIATNLRAAGPFAEDAGGIGKVQIDRNKWAVVYPWMEEIEYLDSIEAAEAFEQRLRESGPPSEDDATEEAILNALEGNGDAPKGDDDAPKGDADANPAGADADQADPDAPKGDADASDAKTDADGDDDPDADADGADEEE